MSASEEAIYEALLFDPLAHMRTIVLVEVVTIAAVTALLISEFYIPAIVVLALSPVLLMVVMVERGVWHVDRDGVRATLKPVVPFLPERREATSWSGIDSFEIRTGQWVPRYLKVFRAQRALMTVYEPAEDDAKAAAFGAFAAAFEKMAATHKVRRR